VRLAFNDELVKIASDSRKKAIQKWVKTSLAISAGTAAGTGALMIGERATSALLKRGWSKLSPQSRMLILGAGASAAALGANHLAKKMLDQKRKEEA
jgi:hypothetical protein